MALGAETYDFEAINRNLAQALENVVNASADVDRFTYSFRQNETNLDEHRFGFDAEFATSQAPWGDGTLDAKGHVYVEVQDEGYKIKSELTLITDGIDMLRHLAGMATPCPAVGFVGILQVIQAVDCKFKERVEDIDTVEGLQRVFTAHVTEHQASISSYIDSLKKAMTKVPNESLLGLLKDQLAKSESILSALDGTTIELVKDGLSVRVPAFEFGHYFLFGGGSLLVQDSSLEWAGIMQIKAFGKLYTAGRPLVKELFLGLQSGDQTAMKFVQYDALYWRNLMRDAFQRVD